MAEITKHNVIATVNPCDNHHLIIIIWIAGYTLEIGGSYYLVHAWYPIIPSAYVTLHGSI